ncbi:MAG: hypothetical protein RIQ56_703 [Candidatus Parcubacteria bacterium]|jgi:hypothetical protein
MRLLDMNLAYTETNTKTDSSLFWAWYHEGVSLHEDPDPYVWMGVSAAS